MNRRLYNNQSGDLSYLCDLKFLSKNLNRTGLRWIPSSEIYIYSEEIQLKLLATLTDLCIYFFNLNCSFNSLLVCFITQNISAIA